MITDEEVVQLFRDIPGTPAGFSDSEKPGRTNQIFRGIPSFLWNGAHPNGCARHMQIFKQYDVIPKYCFDCYKILIAPRTVMELFKLLMVFEKIRLPLDNARKCMVELRPDCSGAYKGLVYCRGIEEGNEVLKIVRKVISEDISPKVAVTMKRGCSEFALRYPKYARAKPGEAIMQYKKDWQIHEDAFDREFTFSSVVPGVNAARESAYTPAEIFGMKYWLRYAATIGDMSYLAIAGTAMSPVPNLMRPPFRSATSVK